MPVILNAIETTPAGKLFTPPEFIPTRCVRIPAFWDLHTTLTLPILAARPRNQASTSLGATVLLRRQRHTLQTAENANKMLSNV